MDVYQRRRLVALSVLAGVFILFVLLIRSCGGDDEPSPLAPTSGATGATGESALTLDQFIDQADAICLDANTAQADVEEDLSDLERASRQRARIIGNAHDSLRSLPLPEDVPNRDLLNRYLNSLQQQVEGYEDQAVAVSRGEDITEIDTALEEAEETARRTGARFGFNVCGNLDEVSGGEGGDGGNSDAAEATGEAPADTAVAPAPTETAPTETAPPADTAPAPTDGGTPAPDAGGGGDTDGTGGVTP